MIDQVTSMLTTAATVFSQATVGTASSDAFTTNGSGNFTGIDFTTPNGKQILFAMVNVIISNHRCAAPLIVIPSLSLVSFPLFSNNGQSTTDTGAFPILRSQITGTLANPNSQLYCNVLNGNSNVGGGGTPTWTGGTTGTIKFAAVYQA